MYKDIFKPCLPSEQGLNINVISIQASNRFDHTLLLFTRQTIILASGNGALPVEHLNKPHFADDACKLTAVLIKETKLQFLHMSYPLFFLSHLCGETNKLSYQLNRVVLAPATVRTINTLLHSL